MYRWLKYLIKIDCKSIHHVLIITKRTCIFGENIALLSLNVHASIELMINSCLLLVLLLLVTSETDIHAWLFLQKCYELYYQLRARGGHAGGAISSTSFVIRGKWFSRETFYLQSRKNLNFPWDEVPQSSFNLTKKYMLAQLSPKPNLHSTCTSECITWRLNLYSLVVWEGGGHSNPLHGSRLKERRGHTFSFLHILRFASSSCLEVHSST